MAELKKKFRHTIIIIVQSILLLSFLSGVLSSMAAAATALDETGKLIAVIGDEVSLFAESYLV